MMPQLSAHDKAVLTCIFNPNLPIDQVYSEELHDEITDREENTPIVRKSKDAELRAIRKAEEQKFDEALDLINEAIETAPDRASPYNNKAQICQLMGKAQDGAFGDLTRAIDLSEDKQMRTKCQALCQRGLLYRRDGKDELAKRDFEDAAKLGSKFAQNQLIEMNPYAAMCNQMLRQAFESLK